MDDTEEGSPGGNREPAGMAQGWECRGVSRLPLDGHRLAERLLWEAEDLWGHGDNSGKRKTLTSKGFEA